LIDLKRPAKQSDYEAAPISLGDSDKSQYPYGLRLHLEKEELEKLGDSVADLSKGDRITLRCVAEVVSLSVNEDEYGESANMGLQIQKMEVGAAAGARTTVRDALSTLRGKSS
jgi:hypothetical protein